MGEGCPGKKKQREKKQPKFEYNAVEVSSIASHVSDRHLDMGILKMIHDSIEVMVYIDTVDRKVHVEEDPAASNNP